MSDNETIKDTDALKKFLSKKYPNLKQHFIKDQMLRIAVNLEYITSNTKIKNDDEIAIFPPVSGG